VSLFGGSGNRRAALEVVYHNVKSRWAVVRPLVGFWASDRVQDAVLRKARPDSKPRSLSDWACSRHWRIDSPVSAFIDVHVISNEYGVY